MGYDTYQNYCWHYCCNKISPCVYLQMPWYKQFRYHVMFFVRFAWDIFPCGMNNGDRQNLNLLSMQKIIYWNSYVYDENVFLCFVLHTHTWRAKLLQQSNPFPRIYFTMKLLHCKIFNIWNDCLAIFVTSWWRCVMQIHWIMFCNNTFHNNMIQPLHPSLLIIRYIWQ